MALTIPSEDLDIVKGILRRYLPADSQVWVYGSRATGKKIWRGSDLDLMVRARDRLSLLVYETLTEEFSESLLPYMVDLHDWHRTDAAFLHRIEPEMVQLPLSVEVELT